MKKLILILFVISCFSCEKEANWKLNNAPLNKIVIEALLTNEQRAQTIKISQTVQSLNDSAQMVSGALVQLIEGSNTIDLKEQVKKPGFYDTDSNFCAKPNVVYRLLVKYKDKSYTASAVMATGFTNKTFQYSYNAEMKLYKADWAIADYQPLNPTMWEVYLDWTYLYGLSDTTIDSCNAKLNYFSLPNIDVSQVFAPENEKVYFPKGTIIWIRQYALSSEYAEYIRALLLETKWRGGFLDSQPANVPSNFSNGALGFFSVCSVTNSLQYAGY